MKRKLLVLLTLALTLILSLGILTACSKDTTYTITVKDGDTVLKTLTLAKDAIIEIDPHDTAFDKAGYEVDGLYTDAALSVEFGADTTATADLTIYVKYEPRPFKIIVIDDPNSVNYTTVDVTYNSAYTLAEPSRTGYLFLGYTHVQDGTPVSFPLNGTYTKTNTISVTAQWKKLASVTVYDELTDEQVGTTVYADAEGNFTLPAVSATKEGYNFGGYAIPGVTLTKQDDGTYTGKVATDSDLNATLKWTPVPTYLLTVNGLYDNDVVAPASYKTGDTFTLPAAPTRDGYRFLGYTVNGQPITPVDGKYTFTWEAATTVTALWAERIYITLIDEVTRLVVAKIEVVNGTYSLTPYLGTDYSEGDKNYEFLGFTLGLNGPTFATTSQNYAGGSVTVYRDWEGADKIFVTIHSVGANKNFAAIEIVDDHYTPLTPELATLTGYYFLGYFADEACTTSFANDGTATTDVTVYAKYHPIITITVYDNNNVATGVTVTVQQDGSFTIPAPANKEGYVFQGYTIPGVTLTKQDDGTYTGIYKGTAPLSVTEIWSAIPKFNWSVNANGGSFDSNAVTSGTAYESSTVTLPTPTRDGYVFDGYAYGDGTKLTANGNSYVLPAYADVETVNLKLTAVWKVDNNAEGEQFAADGTTSREFFREIVGNELVYVFLTGRTYYFGTAELTFGGNYATAITAVTDATKGNGFTATAPGSFTMTQNGQTVNCRVEYYVGSMNAGANTSGRNESNFKGGIDKTESGASIFDAGIENFLPDLVGGNIAIDKIPYEIVKITDEKGNEIQNTLYEILPNGKLSIDPVVIGGNSVETLTITYKPKYGLKADNVTASVTIRPNNGVNVYTNDELYTAYADLGVKTINILRNISATLQPQHYSYATTGEILVHNDDYRNGVYVRLPKPNEGNDAITINGNCYTIDASKLPAINPELVAADPTTTHGHTDAYYGRWAEGYSGWSEGIYQLVNVQAGIFVYYQAPADDAAHENFDGDLVTSAGGTLTMNDLYITGNEFEITKSLDAGTTKSYWEKTYTIAGAKQVVGSSGAMHGVIVRQANAVLDNVKIDHTHSALHTEGYDQTFEENEVKKPGTPTALLTKITLNNTILDQNFNSSFFAWGQVGLEITNTKMGRSSGPAIIFSDTPIVAKSMAYASYIHMDSNTVIENFVTGAEPWFQAFRADGAATQVKTDMVGAYQLFAAYGDTTYEDTPVLLSPIRKIGNDGLDSFNAMIVTNTARSSDSYDEDPIKAPFTFIKIDGKDLDSKPVYRVNPQTQANVELPPIPELFGGKYYQHIPMTGSGASSMQVVIEAFLPN